MRGPDIAPRRRRRAGRRLLAALVTLVVLLALAATAGVQLHRATPPLRVSSTLPAALHLPGRAVQLPWPHGAQATVLVPGVGSFGRSGPGGPVPIGSIAKVMTCYLVLRDHPLRPGQDGPTLTVTAKDAADYRSRAGSGQSLLPVHAGEKLTERQALQAALIPSANNIADLLARWEAGSVAAFVQRMNRAAHALGLNDTRYTDPSGYDAGTVSTAVDQARLADRALGLPAFARTVARTTVTLPGLGLVHNYNSLLGTAGVVGVKTGSTDAAGGNLVFAAQHQVGGRTVTIVGSVLGADVGAPPLTALAEAITASGRLVTAAEGALGVRTVLPAGAVVGQVEAPWSATAPLATTTALKAIGWPGLTVHPRLTPDLVTAPAAAGAVAGTLTVGQASGAASVQVATTAAVPAPGLWWRLTRR